MVPPVPIPNTVVKHSYVESTWLETAWEDRALPVYGLYEALVAIRVLFVCFLQRFVVVVNRKFITIIWKNET